MATGNTTILNKSYKKLLLQVALNEISYVVFDTLRQRIEQVKQIVIVSKNETIETSLSKIFAETDDLKIVFDDILVYHNSNLITFVPTVLFDEDFKSSYLQYNTKVFETDYFASDVVPNYEMNAVYIPYVNINNYLIDHFGSFDYKHSATFLVQKILDFSKNIEETQIYIYIKKNDFQIVVVKNQKLLLFNSFDYATSEDFIYYLLFTFEQLDLNPEMVPVKLLGTISKDNDLFKIAYKYIRNVSLFLDHNNLDNAISQQDYLNNFILIHACE